MPPKSLEQKLAAIHADPYGCREFIIADAKDADMGFGVSAPGQSMGRDGLLRPRSLAGFREEIRLIVQQGIVDIMLMSASTSEALTIHEGLFANSHVTPAVRANDATDIWVFRGSRIGSEASRPFRTASLDHIQGGRLDCRPEERVRGANLGLYSITFNNDRDRDRESLLAYKEFREEAERKGFRHFLEVFAPNAPAAVDPTDMPSFLIDAIARCLAGVTSAGRPLFLKIPYLGPGPLEELVTYDPHLVVGILGGSAGTTRDAFQLIHDAQKHGARVALFGRRINQAEHQRTFIQFLREIVQENITPDDAVRAYHDALHELGLPSRRPLQDDQQLTSAHSPGDGLAATGGSAYR